MTNTRILRGSATPRAPRQRSAARTIAVLASLVWRLARHGTASTAGGWGTPPFSSLLDRGPPRIIAPFDIGSKNVEGSMIESASKQTPNLPVSSWLTSLPYVLFRRYRWFYVAYDLVYLIFSLSVIFALRAIDYQAPITEFSWTLLLGLPVATYLVIMAHVFIHNASHGNCGPKWLNRLTGELCGVVVLTKFASWEIVHRRHHRYTDDPVRDPHPAERNYWIYAYHTLINVEHQLQQQYFDIHGDTEQSRRYERFRSVLSFVSGLVMALTWAVLLGLPLFLIVYLPAFVFAALFVIFFNWAGHNAHTKDGPIEPTNLDHGIFWILNRMFFGIFYHGNHHRMAMIFNPMRVPQRAPLEADAAE